MTTSTTGIKQRIQVAKTKEEVKSLIIQMSTYKWASRKTRSACNNAADARIQALK